MTKFLMYPIKKINPCEFLELAKSQPVIDVRSPSEFRQGHIPGAFNIPLFDDEERAMVGTTYTHSGNKAAKLKGLELVGPKLRQFVLDAEKISQGRELLLHCWRGGMRSEAMAWLFSFYGLKTHVMEGGYKAYRWHIRKALTDGPKLFVLSGMTGSGKTEILSRLTEAGVQVIDLEKLAHHKGSAFGALGQELQPTTEQFENDLAGQYLAMSLHEPVWVEDESMNIGKVIIPEPFYSKMLCAPLIYLEVPFELRVNRLIREYGGFSRDELAPEIMKIRKRMGDEKVRNALSSLDNGDLQQAVSEVLAYYDRTYLHSLGKKQDQIIRIIQIQDESEIINVPSLLKTIR